MCLKISRQSFFYRTFAIGEQREASNVESSNHRRRTKFNVRLYTHILYNNPYLMNTNHIESVVVECVSVRVLAPLVFINPLSCIRASSDCHRMAFWSSRSSRVCSECDSHSANIQCLLTYTMRSEQWVIFKFDANLTDFFLFLSLSFISSSFLRFAFQIMWNLLHTAF